MKHLDAATQTPEEGTHLKENHEKVQRVVDLKELENLINQVSLL